MLNKKNRKIISILSAVFVIVLIFSSLWVMIKGGYDKQNKIILVLKEFIPTNISRKIRDTVLYIPKLQEEKELLKLEAFNTPTVTNMTTMYRILTITKERIIANGTFLAGFLTSSAILAILSKPP